MLWLRPRRKDRCGRLAGAESLERLECCRLVADVVERPCCCLNLCEGDFAPLDTEAREPAQRRALESPRFGVTNGDAHLEGVARSTPGSSAAAFRIRVRLPRLQGPPEAGVGRSLTRHEHMFACRGPRGMGFTELPQNGRCSRATPRFLEPMLPQPWLPPRHEATARRAPRAGGRARSALGPFAEPY